MYHIYGTEGAQLLLSCKAICVTHKHIFNMHTYIPWICDLGWPK